MVIVMDKIEVIRCSSCGSTDIENIGGDMGKCSHCGSTMIIPKKQGEIISLLNNAYIYRANFNYDLAIKSYQFILEKDSNELAAYEGILLSEYGIEYVKDSYTGKMIPTCHRAHFKSILEDPYYQTLITLASDEQKTVIEQKVKEIDKLQKAIERQLKNEESYDVFISYKDKDKNGDKTEDALIARQIYEELSNKNYRVFFAEKSLEDRVGSEYEPIIFKALHTSKIFILVLYKGRSCFLRLYLIMQR
jgi:tetratricopeptide (TPR) repeat protein